MRAVPELIGQKLRRLREEAELSRGALSHATVRLGFAGVPEVTIEAIEKSPGRLPDADIIEALSRALDIEPTEFYEWPIAVARRDARGRRPARVRVTDARIPEIRRRAEAARRAQARRARRA